MFVIYNGFKDKESNFTHIRPQLNFKSSLLSLCVWKKYEHFFFFLVSSLLFSFSNFVIFQVPNIIVFGNECFKLNTFLSYLSFSFTKIARITTTIEDNNKNIINCISKENRDGGKPNKIRSLGGATGVQFITIVSISNSSGDNNICTDVR